MKGYSLEQKGVIESEKRRLAYSRLRVRESMLTIRKSKKKHQLEYYAPCVRGNVLHIVQQRGICLLVTQFLPWVSTTQIHSQKKKSTE